MHFYRNSRSAWYIVHPREACPEQRSDLRRKLKTSRQGLKSTPDSGRRRGYNHSWRPCLTPADHCPSLQKPGGGGGGGGGELADSTEKNVYYDSHPLISQLLPCPLRSHLPEWFVPASLLPSKTLTYYFIPAGWTLNTTVWPLSPLRSPPLYFFFPGLDSVFFPPGVLLILLQSSFLWGLIFDCAVGSKQADLCAFTQVNDECWGFCIKSYYL